MGMAKYAEDNYEIMLERQYYKQIKDAEYKNNCSRCKPSDSIVSLLICPSVEKITPKQPFKKHYEDRYIECEDCGEKFLFTAKSQKYFETQGWKQPKRCSACREERKEREITCLLNSLFRR